MRKTFFCIDAHTCGNPVRLVAGGGPLLQGASMAERRLHFLRDYDWIRRGLMFEPRGHDMMSGSILYPPTDPQNDICVLFIETSGCLPMCGHGTIGTVTIAVEEGLVQPRSPGKLRLETPAGLVLVEYKQEAGKVKSVKLTNIPSFLYKEKLEVECPDRWSPVLRNRLNEQHNFQHPLDENIRGLSHLLWTGKTLHPDSTARNAVFYGDKAIDRSPCGTGTSARMAQWAAKGILTAGDEFVHESIIGSRFTGRVESVTTCGPFLAIVPSIEGWARVTGYNTIVVDPEDDPYALGFQVL